MTSEPSTAQTTAPRIEGYGFDISGISEVTVPYNNLIGIEWDLFSPDRVEAHVDVVGDHHQPYGIVHGGLYCSLVEGVGSAAAAARVMDTGLQVVGVHNSTHFLRPVREGRISVVATPIHVGRTQHLWLVEMSNAAGKPCARGELRLSVIQMRDS